MTTAATLPVPGATLHHERRGSGPVLLLIPGGAGDAGLFEGIADLLAAHCTVVSYDQRGLSRSPLDGPPADQSAEVWADDARRLLDLHSPDAPAYVLGTSSGAITALMLAARHPDRVRRVVAHEPPLTALLADPAPATALYAEVRDLHRTAGVGPAMARFAEGLGGGRAEASAPTELAPAIREMATRMHANLPYFLEHVLVPFTSSAPDLPGLRAAADRLVLAVGRDSADQPALTGPARRLAELLPAPVAEFPGGHLGCTTHPAEFAARLLAVLDVLDDPSAPAPSADIDALPVFEFAFPGPLRDQLVGAVRSGAKTTTTGLAADYATTGDPLPRPGHRAAVIDSAGRRVAVIELTEVRVLRLADVDLRHAVDEGEGDETVAQWRTNHESFWHGPEVRAELGPDFTVDDDTEVVAQRFRVLWQA
ncbi:alpha/beta fold hydrolase [Kitasatospora sp. NPDC051853]|uniref:alpha/beta fold hydrolase n=1 Tax=Kitasatospora sp. NPDC051853 TaxID=3364058 RepID=UPI0037B96CE1